MLLFLACHPAHTIEVFARTDQETVNVLIDEVSLRASTHGWYEQWHQLTVLQNTVTIDSETIKIAEGSFAHNEYLHLFLDVQQAFWMDDELIDIVEPISVDKPIRPLRNRIDLELQVLMAPDGLGLFLTDARVHSSPLK